MEAPREIYLVCFGDYGREFYEPETVTDEIKETAIKYHHDDKYQKAIEALKMCLHTTDPFELMSEIEDRLKELGEVD